MVRSFSAGIREGSARPAGFNESEIEFWYARDLQGALGYDRWENFKKVIDKAIVFCKSIGVNFADHFRDVTKMVQIGSGAERPIEDILQLFKKVPDI